MSRDVSPPICINVTGRWGGALKTGNRSLRIVLEIDTAGSASILSIDQGNMRIPATGGTCTPEFVNLEFASVTGHLDVRRTDDGAFAGTWRQNRTLPIRLVRLDADEVPEPRSNFVHGPLSLEVPRARAQAGAPALIAGWRSGQRQKITSDGKRAAGHSASTDDNDLWHVGSITKSMTGTMLARLVERGIIDWGETLGTALRGTMSTIRNDYRSASLGELLTGRSGLPTNIAMTKLRSFQLVRSDPQESRLEYAREVLSMPPEGQPGESFIYPNNGFVVAAMIAEQRTGKSWETLITEEVFRPLGMTSAGFGPPPSKNPRNPDNPVGHRNARLGKRPVPIGNGRFSDNPPVLRPAGGVHMSMTDLLSFGHAHACGLAGKSDSAPGYLSEETWRYLHSAPEGSTYAVGWVLRPDGVSWHNGSNTFFYAELSVNRAARSAAVSATNWAGAEDAVSRSLQVAEKEASEQQ